LSPLGGERCREVMEKKLYEYLWTTFNDAKNEKTANPISTRLDSVRDLATKARIEQASQLAAIEQHNANVAKESQATGVDGHLDPRRFDLRAVADGRAAKLALTAGLA
jgi:hypothetical protein